MIASVRFRRRCRMRPRPLSSVQPVLPLESPPLCWDRLPPPTRERVLQLWAQLLAEALERDGVGATPTEAA
jgi:hypothetical protein